VFEQVRAASRGRARRRPTLTWAFAAAIVLTSAGLIASATVGHWPRLFSPTVTPIPSPAAPTQKIRAAKGTPAPVPASEPAMVPLPPPAVSNPRPVVAARLPTPKPHSTLSEESQLLGQAMVQLRQQRDAQAALAALDQYAARFPRGTLKREATIARVDALLMLKRDRGALALLKQLDLQAQQRDQELRVIRGELSASENCTMAIADFDRVLTESPDPTLIQRALYGRAGCRLRRGDSAGATRDLEQYLQQFPHGRFATEARQARADHESQQKNKP
jgi:TolA-binding protein